MIDLGQARLKWDQRGSEGVKGEGKAMTINPGTGNVLKGPVWVILGGV